MPASSSPRYAARSTRETRVGPPARASSARMAAS
jgi:hypothetical protein